MRENIFKAAEWLNVDENLGYGLLPIPNERDEEISLLLNLWLTFDPEERIHQAAGITEDKRFTLIAFSERMATQAVRSNDTNYIFLGLIAIGIDGWRSDWRDNMTILCLHYDASKKNQINPTDIFERAGSKLSEKVHQSFLKFLTRSEEDKSLDSMGYLENTDGAGFSYKREW